MKKVAIIGSTQYEKKFRDLANHLTINAGFDVRTPAFDSHPEFNELQVCEYNREIIEWADEVIMIWDQRSTGTIFDFGMVFMARKPFKIHYLEPKTFKNLMEQYACKSTTAQ